MDAINLISAIGGVLGGGTITGVVTALVGRRKVKAEADQIEADVAAKVAASYLSLLNPLRDEVARLSKSRLEDVAQIDALVKEIRALKIENAQQAGKLEVLEAKCLRLQQVEDECKRREGDMVREIGELRRRVDISLASGRST